MLVFLPYVVFDDDLIWQLPSTAKKEHFSRDLSSLHVE